MNPVILLLCYIGAYTAKNSMGDLIVLMIFGGIGYFMVRYKWPRPPFILGFVLGKLAESYLYSSVLSYGAAWLIRPKVIIIFCIALAFAFYPYIQKRFMKKEVPDEPDQM